MMFKRPCSSFSLQTVPGGMRCITARRWQRRQHGAGLGGCEISSSELRRHPPTPMRRSMSAVGCGASCGRELKMIEQSAGAHSTSPRSPEQVWWCDVAACTRARPSARSR